MNPHVRRTFPTTAPRRRRLRPRALAAIVCSTFVVLAALVPATATVASAAGRKPAEVVLTGRTSKLSPRLQNLRQPQVMALSGAARSQAMGLVGTGAGSLMERPGGRIVVQIRFTDTSSATLDAVAAAGVTDLSLSAPDGVADGVVSPDALGALAAVPGVASVKEEITPMVGSGRANLAPSAPVGTSVVPPCPTGVVSEGDAQLKANTARTNFSVDGTGVRVGVLSDSFNHLGGAAGDVTAAELPGAANTCGYTTPVTVQADAGSGEDEGRAMAQIVHDLAPGSPLSFATAFNGVADFANQIRNLKTNGASIIVDDVTYFQEPMFQDGIIAKAVDDVVAGGVTYYSSAANNTVTQGGHDVTSYESGAFRSTACPAAINTFEGSAANATCHNFLQGGTDNGDTIVVGNNKTVRFALSYNQPQGGVTTDLDFFLVDGTTGAIVANGADANVTGEDPSEFLGFQNTSGAPRTLRVVVARYTGPGGGDSASPRFKFVTFPNGDTGAITSFQYNVTTGNDIVGPTVIGHNGASRAATVAAVPYNNSAVVEPYSSHGPLKKCWQPTTATAPPYTPPGAAINPCQTKTVDFAATDGGLNNFFPPGSGPPFRFFGTSAAAPHAAAVGALARQKYPCRTPDEILAAQRASAVPMGFGVDVVGSGLVDANAMLGTLSACVSTLFHPLTPARVLDSRPATNVGDFATPWTTGTSRDVIVGGRGGVPANADAVVLNVTVTGTTASSFLTLWPTGQAKPTASSLNWTAGRTIPNVVTVKLGTAGKVSVFNLSGNVDVVIDVAGYYDTNPGDGFTSLPPARVLDSRPATNVGDFATPWTTGTSRDVIVGGRGGVPADADAVVLNVTVTDTSASSFLTLWPTGQTKPTASNLNWTGGLTIPNAVTVKLGTAGKVSVFNLLGNVNVIIDVAGYYKSGTGNPFHALSPTRVLDSRPATQVGIYSTPWGGATTRTVAVGGLAGVPTNADSVVLNTTVTNTTGSSFLTLFPAGAVRPTASNLNWAPGLTIPNAVTVKLGTAGALSVYNLSGNVDVITDVAGWFG